MRSRPDICYPALTGSRQMPKNAIWCIPKNNIALFRTAWLHNWSHGYWFQQNCDDLWLKVYHPLEYSGTLRTVVCHVGNLPSLWWAESESGFSADIVRLNLCVFVTSVRRIVRLFRNWTMRRYFTLLKCWCQFHKGWFFYSWKACLLLHRCRHINSDTLSIELTCHQCKPLYSVGF